MNSPLILVQKKKSYSSLILWSVWGRLSCYYYSCYCCYYTQTFRNKTKNNQWLPLGAVFRHDAIFVSQLRNLCKNCWLFYLIKVGELHITTKDTVVFWGKLAMTTFRWVWFSLIMNQLSNDLLPNYSEWYTAIRSGLTSCCDTLFMDVRVFVSVPL